MASIFSKTYMKDVMDETRDALNAIDEGKSMNKDEVRRIIEEILKSGKKTPGLFDMPKIFSLKSKLEACTSISEVIGVLEENRSLIMQAFGLSDYMFREGVECLNCLERAA